MKITPMQVTISDLTKNYKDDGDGGECRRLSASALEQGASGQVD